LLVTQKQFLEALDKHLAKHRNGYIDAIIAVCEDMNIDPEQAARYLTKPIIEKIRIEGENINLLPHSPKLPI